jgi:sec-independent protein translocase protein TatC
LKGSALVRLGALSGEQLRRNRRTAYVALVAFAILLPTVDPVSLPLEVAPARRALRAFVGLATVCERRSSAVVAVSAVD